MYSTGDDDDVQLPEGMRALGFKLVRYPDGSMVAVSSDWGCSLRSTELDKVIASARNIYGFIRWAKRKQAEDQQRWAEHDNEKSSRNES